jgi:hypothetical protein
LWSNPNCQQLPPEFNVYECGHISGTMQVIQSLARKY